MRSSQVTGNVGKHKNKENPVADNPKHGPTSSEHQNEVAEPAAPATEAVETSAAAEEPQQAPGLARASVRVMPASGASTHPTG